jgi:hypothetical protein
MPKPMKYDRQGVLCLAADLSDTADSLWGKRAAAGESDKTHRVNMYGWRGGTATEAAFSDLPLNSRLIILVHGDENSTVANGRYTPAQLAALVKSLLGGRRIQRISLHMCYGGGNKGTATGSNSSEFHTSPQDSFAQKFASIAGEFAREVSARTDVVSGLTYRDATTGAITNFQRTVGDRRKTEGDKLVFTVNSTSTLANPVQATRSFVWKNA